MAPPKVKPFGGRVVIPKGYLLGRISNGDGPPELISIEQAKAHGLIPVALRPIGPAGGDLGGTYPDPLVTGLQGTPVDDTAPTDGQVLIYSHVTGWTATTFAVAGLLPTGGTAGQVLTKIDGVDFHADWETPAAGGGATSFQIDASNNYYVAISDASGQLVLDGLGNPVFVENPAFNFSASNLGSGTIPNARIVALPNANLANSSITIAGHVVALGGTQTLADTDISGTTAGAIPFVSAANKLTEDTTALFWDATNKRLGIGTATPAQMLDIESSFGSCLTNMSAIALIYTRNTADRNGASNILRKSRGNSTTPTVVLPNDVIGTFSFSGYTGTGTTYGNCAQLACQVIDPTPSTTAMGGRLFLSVSPIGSVTQTEMIRLEPATGMSMFGANPVIDANRCHVLRGFTVATLPTPSGTTTKMPTAFVNDATLAIAAGLGLAPIGGGGNRVPVFDDGAWKIG